MRGFIGLQGGRSVFKFHFREPRIFFGRVSFPPNEVFVIGGRTSVFRDLLNFIFLFSIDKVRGWCRGINSVGLVFLIGR